MYHYVCHTCEQNDTFADLESAQVVFNEHAQGRHDVVLRRVDSPVDELTPGPGTDASAAETPEREASSGGSDPIDG